MRSFRPYSGLIIALLLIFTRCAGTDSNPTSRATTQSPITSTQTPAPSPSSAPSGTLEVHFPNVGQSASTLLVGPTGETMLIDTGHYSDNGEDVLSYLKRNNITRIDYLVVSHNDADHIGGNARLIQYYET